MLSWIWIVDGCDFLGSLSTQVAEEGSWVGRGASSRQRLQDSTVLEHTTTSGMCCCHLRLRQCLPLQ